VTAPAGPPVRRVQIAVAGASACGVRVARLAEAVGRALAAADAVVVCGGRGGVMEAVARGVAGAGGIVVGLLPGYDRQAGNRHLTVVLPTGLGWARNTLVAAAGDALIALPGRDGTRSEIALARVLGCPVVSLGRRDERLPGVRKAATPEEAVRRALAAARRRLAGC